MDTNRMFWRVTGRVSLTLTALIAGTALAGTTALRLTRAANAGAPSAAAQEPDFPCREHILPLDSVPAGGRGGAGAVPTIRERGKPPRSAADSAKFRELRLCVDRTDDSRSDRSRRKLDPDHMRLAMVHSMIPEYHDEQRLPDGSGGLGPKAAIYASPYLRDFNRPGLYAAHDNEGILVAHVVVELEAGERMPLPTTYTALGLSEGVNCVWLARPSGAASFSAIVRHAPAGQECNRYGGGGTSLIVQTQSLGTSPNAYPPVARFSQSQSGAPLLGVSCLNAWCEIGAPEGGSPFQMYKPLPVDLGVMPLNDYMRVKAWHDEQFLSVQSTSGRWRPTGIRAALVPATDLASMDESRFETGVFVPVAVMYLDADPPTATKYYAWGLRGGRAGNTIALRKGAAGWEAEMTSATGMRHEWFFGKRHQHYDVGVPGTVRFRWTILDDGIWTPCGQACCRVEGY